MTDCKDKVSVELQAALCGVLIIYLLCAYLALDVDWEIDWKGELIWLVSKVWHTGKVEGRVNVACE